MAKCNPLITLSPSRNFLRSVIARSLTTTQEEADSFIFKRYRFAEEAVTKAMVGDINEDDLTPISAAQQFLDRVWEKSIFSVVPGWRLVNFYTPFQSISDGAVAYWVAQNAPGPITKAALVGDSLDALKLAAAMVFSNSSLDAKTELAEARLEADILYALVAALNSGALDPANAGIPDEMPASLTYGAPAVSATADPAADINNLIESFSGDWELAAIVSDPATLMRLGNARDANGKHTFADVGPRGGLVRGIPAYATRLSARDSNGGVVTLIDPAGCVVAMDRFNLRRSKEASVLMTDTFDSNAPAQHVNMFQTEATCLQATWRCNWKVQRSGSVACITGANW